jgi:glycosyltransferase involved in cell wall biosynthesis
MRADISVVVAVYRGERSITELVERTLAVFGREDIDGEIILVNDGSPDASWDVISRLTEEYGNVVGIDLMRNYGQHGALLCGIRAATKSLIVTMDDDLENPPEYIPLLLDKLAEGYDLVYATPQSLRHSPWRNVISRAMRPFYAKVTGIPALAGMTAYKLFRTQLRDAFADTRSPDVYIDFMFPWGTTKIANIYVAHDRRKFGQSNYSFAKLAALAIGLVVGHTIVPLRLASFVGFVFTLFGIGVFVFAVTRSMIGHTLPGFTFMASLVALMSGAQLFAIGIIGEYIARMYKRTIDCPAYVVRSRLGGDGEERPAGRKPHAERYEVTLDVQDG